MVDGGFRQGGFQLVAQAQGYQLVCIWGSLVKFQEAGLFLRVLFVLDCGFAEIRPGLISVSLGSVSHSN